MLDDTRSLPPSPRRLQELRSIGVVPLSQLAISCAAIIGLLLGITIVFEELGSKLATDLRGALSSPNQSANLSAVKPNNVAPVRPETAGAHFQAPGNKLRISILDHQFDKPMFFMIPLLLGSFLALGYGLWQTRFLFLPSLIKPNIARAAPRIHWHFKLFLSSALVSLLIVFLSYASVRDLWSRIQNSTQLQKTVTVSGVPNDERIRDNNDIFLDNPLKQLPTQYYSKSVFFNKLISKEINRVKIFCFLFLILLLLVSRLLSVHFFRRKYAMSVTEVEAELSEEKPPRLENEERTYEH